jgi:hypothetical protein
MAGKKDAPIAPTQMSADQSLIVSQAGAGSLSDYARQAHAEGGQLAMTAAEAANAGAGFVQDMLKAGGGSEEIPTLTSLDPDTAVLGDPDLVLTCNGSGFTAASVINFAGQDEPTTLVSDTVVTTGVKPSLGWGAGPQPVYVKSGSAVSETLQFTFTEPAAETTKKGK